MGDFEKAIEYYQQAIQISPSYTIAITNLTNAQKELEKIKEKQK